MKVGALASIAYIDIAIGVILGLGVLIGAISGFAKAFKKSFLVVVIISLLLCGVTAGFLRETSVGMDLTTLINTKLEQIGGAAFNQPLYYDEANSVYYVLVNGEQIAFADALAGTSLAWANMILVPLLPKILNGEVGISLVGKMAPALTNIIFMLISFVLLCIIVKLVFVILNKLYQMVLDKVYILKVVDKIMGCLYSGLKAFIFVVIAMSIVGLIAGLDFPQASILQEQISISTIGRWLLDNNLISQVFSKIFA